MSDEKPAQPFYFDFTREKPGHTVFIGPSRQGKGAATVQRSAAPSMPCMKCGYPPGSDWLDGGETCPRCKLVQ